MVYPLFAESGFEREQLREESAPTSAHVSGLHTSFFTTFDRDAEAANHGVMVH